MLWGTEGLSGLGSLRCVASPSPALRLVLSGLGSLRCVCSPSPALRLVLSGLGKSSVFIVWPALVLHSDWSCLAWGSLRLCASPSPALRLVLSGLGSLRCVPALVLHLRLVLSGFGQSSVSVPALVLHSDWSCLAWAVFSVCQP